MLMLPTAPPLRTNFAERLLDHDTMTSSGLSAEAIVLGGNELQRKGVLSFSCRRYCPRLKVSLIIMLLKSKQAEYVKLS